MRKRKLTLAIFMAMTLSLTACAKNPDSSVVTNKNLDNMIDEAENTGENANYYEDVINEVEENSETYQTVIEDESLRVTVNVDATVTIPEATQLSVMRVSKKKIDQAFLDNVMEVLTPGMTYYDGTKANVDTKADIAEAIAWREAYVEKYPELAEEYQSGTDELYAEYESAPSEINVTDYVSDGKLHTGNELYESDPDLYSDFSDSPDMEYYYGISDASEGTYISLMVDNDPDLDNELVFHSSRNVFKEGIKYNIYANILDPIVVEGEAPKGEYFAGYDYYNADFILYDNESVTISESEAVAKADDFLNTLGLTEYRFYDGGLCYEVLNTDYDNNLECVDTAYYREVYEFQYMRNIDGVFVDNTAGYKSGDDFSGGSYSKWSWSGEVIRVYVNDSGIVGFNYFSPLSIDETVVEKSSIKSFDEIKGIFENMVVIQNAPAEEDIGTVNIDVDSVKLMYARISEQDSYDTGLLVPVWNFYGTITDPYGNTTEGVVLTINAIDGSIIDWSLGY